jgi:hypothetical protein
VLEQKGGRFRNSIELIRKPVIGGPVAENLYGGQ